MSQVSQLTPTAPFEYLQIDFIELSPCEGKKYSLMLVEKWSKWVEAFPTSKQDAAAVAKVLLTEIVPRWGVPQKISSDNGTHFVNEAIKEVGKFLGINLRTHCSYRPASWGWSRTAKQDNKKTNWLYVVRKLDSHGLKRSRSSSCTCE